MKIVAKPLPPFELVSHLLEVSADSPSGLVWLNPRTSSKKPGDIAGYYEKGYWRVGITTDKSRLYLAHRIIYFLQTKVDPREMDVDHVNGLTDLLALRLATRSQNNANAKKHKSGFKKTSKYKGVSWDGRRGKWVAWIRKNGKGFNLGATDSETDAAIIYNKAAIEFFGEFAKLNELNETI